MRDDVLLSSDFIGAAYALSYAARCDGSNTNARSLRAPSPLMSWLTIGVYGVPELRRAIDVISNDGVTGHVSVARNWCMRWRSLVPQPTWFGFPAVVDVPKP